MVSVLLLLFGVFCCSTSAPMIKASGLHPAVLASYRLLLASLFLAPVYFANVRKHRGKYSWRHLRLTLLPALVLALHFISWAQGAQLTPTGNASMIVNMVPVVVPFLLFFTLREKVTVQDGIGIAVALAGVTVLAASDFSLSREHVWGDIVCFASMLLFSVYLVLGRLNRDVPNLWLYLVPVYALAGCICLGIAAVVADPFALHPARANWSVLGLALIPTIIGHSILNYSIQRLNGQVVSVCNLLQFIFAGLMGYVLFDEVPHLAFYGAGALVMGGTIIVILGVAKKAAGDRELKALAAEEGLA